jgi:beta-ureidopropionase
MSRIVRAALTETCNAYPDMPERIDDLRSLEGRLEAVRKANVDHHIELLATAAAQGVQIICFGELFPAPYFALGRDPMWLGCAEDATTGPTVTELRAAAKEHGVVVFAPIFEACARSGKRFNTAVAIDAGGEILGIYRKTHIPEGHNEQTGFYEKFYYEGSDGQLGEQRQNVSSHPFFPVWDTGVGRVGVAICYDRHFPRVMETLAREGAEIILSPAITFGAKSRRMWDYEFPVDACRYNVFIGGSNRRGTERPFQQEYFGSSYFVGPNTRIEPLSPHPNLVIADLDLDELTSPDPSGWDFARDRRMELFRG